VVEHVIVPSTLAPSPFSSPVICGLIAGTLASYLLGDSVLQFSTVIGTYLFAMGLGSAASRYLRGSLVARFVSIELMVGVVGGFSSSLLFLAFAYTHSFELVLYLLVIAVGVVHRVCGIEAVAARQQAAEMELVATKARPGGAEHRCCRDAEVAISTVQGAGLQGDVDGDQAGHSVGFAVAGSQ